MNIGDLIAGRGEGGNIDVCPGRKHPRAATVDTYKIHERHVEAEIAETVSDVPEHNLRPLSYVGQRAVALDRGAAHRPGPRRSDTFFFVVVRLAVEPIAAAAALQLAGRGVLTRREVPATDAAGDEHHDRRATERDAPVELLQQPRVHRVEQKTS